VDVYGEEEGGQGGGREGGDLSEGKEGAVDWMRGWGNEMMELLAYHRMPL